MGRRPVDTRDLRERVPLVPEWLEAERARPGGLTHLAEPKRQGKESSEKAQGQRYAGPGGLEKLLKFLRRSPIARQPLPDALTRTKARTNYEVIRKALVGFFEDDEELRRHDAANRRQGANMGLWGEDEEDDWEADWNEDDESDWHESWDAALWQDGYQDESWDWSGNAEWPQQAYWRW